MWRRAKQLPVVGERMRLDFCRIEPTGERYGNRVRRAAAGLATTAACVFFGLVAQADIVLNNFDASVYSADTASMNAALGIAGFAIEDFEDTTLLSGLSYTLEDTATVTFDALPATFDATSSSPFNNDFWDGENVLISTFDNATDDYPGSAAQTVTFDFDGGATSFGIGLSNFQSLDGGLAVTDHEVFVNGVSYGLLEDLAAWNSPGWGRNLYLRIDATDGDILNSVGFRNVNQPLANPDTMVFDHAAVQFAAPVVPVPSAAALGLVGLGLVRVVRRKKRKA